MLLSTALILIVGIVFGGICRKIHLPPLVGMIAGGILIGSYGLDLLEPSMQAISSDIRCAALIVIRLLERLEDLLAVCIFSLLLFVDLLRL